jgi:hypothetical protein
VDLVERDEPHALSGEALYEAPAVDGLSEVSSRARAEGVNEPGQPVELLQPQVALWIEIKWHALH